MFTQNTVLMKGKAHLEETADAELTPSSFEFSHLQKVNNFFKYSNCEVPIPCGQTKQPSAVILSSNYLSPDYRGSRDIIGFSVPYLTRSLLVNNTTKLILEE